MIVGLVRAIFYILLFYVIYKIFRFFSALNKASKPRSTPKKQISGTMVKDRTCNTYLPKEDAIRYLHQGKEYFFCSEECKKKFLLEIKK